MLRRPCRLFVNRSVFIFTDFMIQCLLELSKWLEPLEKLHFDIGGIPTLIDYIKQVRFCERMRFSTQNVYAC